MLMARARCDSERVWMELIIFCHGVEKTLSFVSSPHDIWGE